MALAASGAVALPLAAVGYAYRVETEWLEVEHVDIPLAGLSGRLEGFRIGVLADFHLYPHTRLEFIEHVVAEANSHAPDLFVLLGDYVQRYAEAIFDLGPALAKLNARLGTFGVLGNHDWWRGVDVVRTGLRQAGIPLLENRGVVLTHGTTPFYLAGVDDAWAGSPDLESAMKGLPGPMPVILLSHEPDPADRYCRDPRVLLQLSGHSHGGQVRFPGYGSPYCPPYGRKYDLGRYRVNQAWLYTNRGIGLTVPIRFNCRPELTLVTLTRT